ncbi:MAG: PAS domain-containing protein, partial [Myxococcales bacterium]|nr:PAS domain-containing protein [Myxococcales bacterium]
SRFLHRRDGRQGLELLDLVDTELKMVLAGGLQRAKREPAGMLFKGVRITDDAGDCRSYHVRIRAIAGRGGAPHVLVSFQETEAPATAAPEQHEIDLAAVSRDQLGNLEVELAYTKENLHEAIEELETSNEELQATNEELLTSNEELQSTNEELQSVNEELYTVNAEYQRKIAELTELANDMDNLMSSTEIGTIFLDAELRIRKFTPRIGEMFNLVAHDVGRPIDAFTHNIPQLELKDDLKRVLSSGQPVEREHRDQEGRAFFLRLLPYRAQGTIDGVVLTLIDVSGLKAAEDALFHERYLLNSLLATVPDAIYFKDIAGRFIRLNGPMAARLGLSSPEEGEGKTAFELPNREPAMALHAQDFGALREGRVEHYVLQKRVDGGAGDDGGAQWDIATRLPLVDRSGKTVGIIGLLRDVTELKNAEQKVTEAVRRRDEFLAMLSHELRNPLGALVTAASLLKLDEARRKPDGKTKPLDGDGKSRLGGGDGQAKVQDGSAKLEGGDGQAKVHDGHNGKDHADGKPHVGGDRLIQIIDRQSQLMSRLLDDLLDVSRVTQNKIELKKEVVDLHGVLKEAVDAARPAMEARGIRVSLECDGPGELVVCGDPARLHQVHANLLSNAAKYTGRGGHVVLRATREEGAAVVRVQDDGAGIRPDLLESIFDLFVQSPRTLDRAQGGLGVGLTLVRALVSLHGGSVVARSEGEGKGSEFEVRLPIATDEAAIAEPAPSDRIRLSPGARGVVIEDNDDSREMVCELLARVGYECRSAATGDAGLALIEEVAPDFAVVDLGLPGIDGFELARRIRGQPRHAELFLIALTGYGQPADRANTLRAGFDEHLVKPIDPSVLVRALKRRPTRPAPR